VICNTTFWKYLVIARSLFLFALLSFSCTTKEVTVAFNDIDDSFSFSSHNRLLIKLEEPHPDHLLIISPEEYVYYFYQTGSAYDEEIIFKKDLVLDPLNFKGIRYDENTGERIEEKVFTTPGKYILYFADNTETEPENTFFREKVITFR
jgi:hypothetical protein